MKAASATSAPAPPKKGKEIFAPQYTVPVFLLHYLVYLLIRDLIQALVLKTPENANILFPQMLQPNQAD